MKYDLRRIFNPTKEEQEEDRKRYKELHYELAAKKGCSTCKHCVHVRDYPGFVTAEECECSAGLVLLNLLNLQSQQSLQSLNLLPTGKDLFQE